MCADRALPFPQRPETPGMPGDPRASYRRNLDHTAVYIWALDGRAFSGLLPDAPCFSAGGRGSLLSAVEKFLSVLMALTLIFLLRPDINVLPRNFYYQILMMLLQGF